MNVNEQRADVAADVDHALAARLRALRAGSGLSQGQLADRMTALGTDWVPNTVAMVEAGRRRLRVGELVAVALTFSVTIQELFQAPDDAEVGDYGSQGWQLACEYVAASLRAGGGVQTATGFHLDGHHFATFEQFREYQELIAVEANTDRKRAELENYIAGVMRQYTHIKTDADTVRMLATVTYDSDVLAERDQRVDTELTIRSKSDPFADDRAIRGHVTRAIIRELLEASDPDLRSDNERARDVARWSANNGDPLSDPF